MNVTVERAAHEIHRHAEFFYKFGRDKDAAIERGLRGLDGREVDVEAVRKRVNSMPMKKTPLIDCPCTVEDCAEEKFREVLDKGAGAFVTSILSLVKSTQQLAAADPKTVVSAAMTAATLKLPIDPNLGFAYIIPYGKEAQFQMGYKGDIQLAMRTGQYKTINASVVYDGQVEGVDFITGEIIRGKKKSDKVVGYVAYFEPQSIE